MHRLYELEKGKEFALIDIVITILGMIVIVCIWIMLYDSNRFVVVKHEFADDKIRKDCRAVVLSDLHNKCYGKENERLIASIREINPDIILVAGDIPTAKPGKSLDVAIHLMKELAKDYPIYYGNGNHEHRMKLYPEKYGDMNEQYGKALGELDVCRLVNANITLEEYGITIFGSEIDKFYYKRFRVWPMAEDYMTGILGTPKVDSYNILLAHNPDYFPQYVAWGADLVLSGHVHGGMVRIPFWGKGVVSPNVRLFPKYDGGVFKKDKTIMLLGRGLGMHTIPVRLFNPGELLVLEFKKGNAERT
uniref:metallophosphoesterase n=1 Tax=Acetatifactor sp. TaxID=1872090 RepID=UPI0040569052